jgi:hypothetical protein
MSQRCKLTIKLITTTGLKKYSLKRSLYLEHYELAKELMFLLQLGPRSDYDGNNYSLMVLIFLRSAIQWPTTTDNSASMNLIMSQSHQVKRKMS